MKSYFTYNQNTPNVSFGIDNYPKAREKYTLNYEMLFKRDLIGALIVYALPLFILLMVVFSIILVLKKWLESTLSPQTALFFGLVYLHRDMRIRLISSDIIYMEYIFFTTYFMLLLATFYAVALYFSKTLRSSDNNINLIIISLFWPINFTLWLFSTLYVFF